MKLEWSACQIKGGRDYQEDFYGISNGTNFQLLDQEPNVFKRELPNDAYLFVMADGMGGMGHGDEAALSVVRHFSFNFVSNFVEGCNELELLNSSLVHANSKLSELISQEPSKKGMGCTIIAMYCDTEKGFVSWVSVGDSPLWLIRNTKINRINAIHSWGHQAEVIYQRQKKTDPTVTLDYIKGLNQAELLVSGVVGDKINMQDESYRDKLLPGDIFIIASDGLESLTEREIRESLKVSTLKHDLKKQLDNIVIDLMNRVNLLNNPDQDNTTAILVTTYNESDSVVNLVPPTRSIPFFNKDHKKSKKETLTYLVLIIVMLVFAAVLLNQKEVSEPLNKLGQIISSFSLGDEGKSTVEEGTEEKKDNSQEVIDSSDDVSPDRSEALQENEQKMESPITSVPENKVDDSLIKKNWEKAKSLGTIKALADFLKQWPKSQFAQEAQELITNIKEKVEHASIRNQAEMNTKIYGLLKELNYKVGAPIVYSEQNIKNEQWKLDGRTINVMEDFAKKNLVKLDNKKQILQVLTKKVKARKEQHKSDWVELDINSREGLTLSKKGQLDFAVEFINKYPNSEYLPQIRTKVDELERWQEKKANLELEFNSEFNKAQKSNSIATLNRFDRKWSKKDLQLFYKKESKNTIDKRIDGIAKALDTRTWQAALEENTKNAYQNYLKKYEKGSYVAEANIKIEELNSVIINFTLKFYRDNIIQPEKPEDSYVEIELKDSQGEQQSNIIICKLQPEKAPYTCPSKNIAIESTNELTVSVKYPDNDWGASMNVRYPLRRVELEELLQLKVGSPVNKVIEFPFGN